MKRDVDFWIDRLMLREHPEGGYFREIYRSQETIAAAHLPERFKGERAFATSIYFLLKGGQFSQLHRLQSDEIWHFYDGTSLTIYALHPDGILSEIVLGEDIDRGEALQAVVPAGSWFGATVNDPREFTLVGCTVAPGFDFADFEMGERGELLRQFPQHRKIITELTRDD